MLRIIQNASAAGAKSYYSTADYYAEGQELAGRWCGKGAARLGLHGAVDKRAWDALCDNRHPQTGRTLTLRQKANRRIGYDFNYHAPKSLSLLYGLTGDDRLLDAFRTSVDETMRDMEAEMQTRVRTSGRDEDRTTSNAVWGEFIHFTARPVGGVPDPHLHAHCFVFNTTFDTEEGRWKAGQFAGLKRDAPYFEAVFHSRLARRMEELGLDVQRTRTGWELAGIDKAVLGRFSRRTAQVEAEAKAKGIVDPADKAGLGAKTRERKTKDVPLDALRQEWRSRLSEAEAATVDRTSERISHHPVPEDPRITASAVTLAIEHWFERHSVAPQRRVLRDALRRSVGKASVEEVLREFSSRPLIHAHRDGQRLVTTREVLREERRLIDFARNGRGARRPLGGPQVQAYQFTDTRLNAGQRRAVLHILHSTDVVTVVRGAAGTGKTTMLKEAIRGIETGGRRVFAFAPSADASRGVLRSDGMSEADTVARLLLDEQLQERARQQVLVVDEAGLIGSRTMGQLFDLAERIDARLLLLGDRRQHASVERGSALRLLETEAGLVPAELRQIQRQAAEYRRAVEALSDGRVEDGFRQLDELGWISEVEASDRYRLMAQDYLAKTASGDSVLCVSPTHREGDRLTDALRVALKAAGRLGPDERAFHVLANANLTQAERADGVNYTPGQDTLVFHQAAKGFRKGQRVQVGSPECPEVPLCQAARFQLFHSEELRLAPGDLIRITRNGTAADGRRRLNNGAIYRVKGFSAGGDIQTVNGPTISRDYGHLAYGYTTTSIAAQGKSVDHVLIAQSAESHPASSSQQWYVSVSRGKKSARVYTDEKSALLEVVKHQDERLTATDLVARRRRLDRWPSRAEPERNPMAGMTRTPQREELAYER